MGTSLVVQQLKNLPSDARDVGLIPSQGTKMPYPSEQPSRYTTSMSPSALQPSCHK